MTLDEWCAEQCGVRVTKFDLENDQLEQYWEYKGKTYDGKWTLDDAQCREIVREHFNICTTAHRLEAGSDDIRWFSRTVEYDFCVSSKTIAEAEIACITAIWEVS